MLKELIEWLKALLFAVVAVFILNFFVATTTVVNTSMVPTLIEGDLLIVDKISSLDRYDIISFKTEMTLTENDIQSLSPIRRLFVSTNTHKNLIKRIIGLPGDSVAIKNGKVFINNEEIYEEYLVVETFGDISVDKIPEGKLFVMGDNRIVSLDSRSSEVGLVDIESVIGIARFRIWPLNRINIL
jgi:signal peptidase I